MENFELYNPLTTCSETIHDFLKQSFQFLLYGKRLDLMVVTSHENWSDIFQNQALWV